MRLRIALMLGLVTGGLAGCAGPEAAPVRAEDGRMLDPLEARREAAVRVARGDRLLREARRTGGRLDPAIRAYQSALVLDPLLAEAHLRLAHCYYLAREPELERSEYLKCLAIHPGHLEALERLGHARLAQDDLLGAREAYEKVLAIDPRHEVVLFNLHFVEADLGHDARARALLEQVHDLARERRPDLITSD
ncbi:MAG: tetratricopeptide repeat protein [Planctomycetes bacterium]|nr:tetratricopeptide repeat protein [Planctomycetota bacterium]